MTSLTNDNQCKLLVLDIDTNRLTTNDLRAFFITYGPIESIEIFPMFSSAMIYFTSRLTVHRLATDRTCLIDQNPVRLRRFRSDRTNWNVDCHTLRIKLPFKVGMNCKLTETALMHCFQEYKNYIIKINILPNNQALIFFSDYDYLDRILLMPLNSFKINNQSLLLERMIRKGRTQWKQQLSSPVPMASMRDPVIQQLLNQIGYLSQQLREQPGNSRQEIERLEAEIFILKNENAEMKSKQKLSLNQNIEQRLTALEDISNQLFTDQYHPNQRRQRSCSNNKENQIKRHRQM